MENPDHITNADPLPFNQEAGFANQLNQSMRRTFLRAAGVGAAALAVQRVAYGAEKVPAVWGSLEQADQLFESVKKAKGLQYMMFETSYFEPGLWPIRQLFRAGRFGKHVYSEGEYYHYHDGKEPMPSYLGWRDG